MFKKLKVVDPRSKFEMELDEMRTISSYEYFLKRHGFVPLLAIVRIVNITPEQK